MFDISYSPWLILALVGLIFFRPDDWQELAFNCGRWVRRIRAYVLEWQEYLEFTGDNADLKKTASAIVLCDKTNVHANVDMLFCSNDQIGGRIISMPPYV
jgi:Sec-independent protein translocase protein TatA